MLQKFYDFKNLRGDLTGGLVAGVVALPLALAFGVQSGLGATAGLYGAIAVGILAAIFGGTETQASGPTGPMTVVSAALVAAAINLTGAIESAMGLIILTFLLAGLFQILFGILNIAKYIRFLPYPVISGFMSGVGLIIILLQIYPLAGVDSPSSTIGVLTELPRFFAEINLAALGVGALTIAIYYLFPRITKAIPSPLVALIVVSLITYFLGLDVPLIGEIPSGLPPLQIGALLTVDLSAYLIILEYALVLAVLGSIDSLLTSVIADNITKTKHNSNRELIGQGIGNAVAAMFGGIPGAGATKGTVVNINAGGKTRLSGAIHGLFLLVVLLGLGPLAAFIPLPVLAGILIPIGFVIIDVKGLKHLRDVPRADGVVLILVLLITTFGSLIQAVGLGVVLASVLFMKRASDLAEAQTDVRQLDGGAAWTEEQSEFSKLGNRVYVKHLYGPLFFGFTSHFQELMQSVTEARAVVIRMDRVPHMDQSGLYAMEDAVYDLQQRGVTVLLTGLDGQPADMMRSIQLIPELIAEEHIFGRYSDGITWLQENGYIDQNVMNSEHSIDGAAV